jgi:hypothetical protein
MTHQQLERAVTLLSNRMFVRYWRYWNYPEEPQVFAITATNANGHEPASLHRDMMDLGFERREVIDGCPYWFATRERDATDRHESALP